MKIPMCNVIYFLILNYVQECYQLPTDQHYINIVDTCECGNTKSFIARRIVGGEVVESNEYSWMAAILLHNTVHCGGSVINDRYVLTAGHCLHGMKKDSLRVVVGLTDLGKIFHNNKIMMDSVAEIEHIVLHEDFTSNYLHDMQDIGLIKLRNAINFTDKVNPICLPRKDEKFSEKLAFVTGWGRTGQDGIPSLSLRKVSLQVIANDECKTIISIGDHITDSMLCAYEVNKDACQGDSGGPLVIGNHSKMQQIGIVSWGIGCAKPGIPGVYTRLTSYLDWILEHTHDAFYCRDP